MNLFNFFFHNFLAAPTAEGIVNQLFPNVWVFIAHTLATIALLFILSKLVYQPFKRMMRERRNKIKTILVNANEKYEDANKKNNLNTQILTKTKNSVNKIIDDATKKVNLKKDQILNDAKGQSNKIILEAKKQILEENQKNKKKIKETISKSSVLIASKIIEKELKITDHKKIIDKFINDVDLDTDLSDE